MCALIRALWTFGTLDDTITLICYPQPVQKRAVDRIGEIYTAHIDFSQLSSKYQLYKDGKNPNIFIPVQNWEKESDDLLLFDNYFDNSDERLTLYDNEGEEANNGNT